MAKQSIGIGTVVDDGSGDYLRKGGQKINSNFAEIYDNLGDGNVPFPAGSWKKFPIPGTTEINELRVNFGQSFVIDTSATDVDVYLPKGSSADFGKVIKLRDVFGTWGVNRIRLVPARGDTVLGYATPRPVQRKFSDLELVYAVPGSWEYLENKLINKLSSSDLSTVHKKEIIATAGQTEFPNVLGGDFKYNPDQLDVYRKGNLLFYGSEFSDESDYGSIGEADDVVKLDGVSIKLRRPCDEGDIITVTTFLDDIATYRSSYTTATVTAYDNTLHPDKVSLSGKQWVGDLTKKKQWTFDDFGLTMADGTFNPFTTEVLLNGINLTPGGRGDMPAFVCAEFSDTTGPTPPTTENYLNDIIPNAETPELCAAKGGDWVYSGLDFTVVPDGDDESIRVLFIRRPLEDGDILTVRWYNNDIGTVMEIDEIIDTADKRYLKSLDDFTITGAIRYNTFNDPTPRDVEPETADALRGRLETIPMLLDIIYPIGSMYMNAHNKNNPFEYMGFGQWVPYAQGKTIIGWEDGDDANFSFYEDEEGRLKTPGGSGGELSHTLQKNEIPTLSSSDEVLIKDPDGTIIIGECQMDPTDNPDGPAYHKYREDNLDVNVVPNPVAIPVLQPYITVSIWLRIA